MIGHLNLAFAHEKAGGLFWGCIAQMLSPKQKRGMNLARLRFGPRGLQSAGNANLRLAFPGGRGINSGARPQAGD
jgi:hypothetical protein